MHRNSIFWVTGLAFLALGLFLPRAWYDALVTVASSGAFPLKGVTLLQICLVLEGLLLIAVAWTGWRYVRLPQEHRFALPAVRNQPSVAAKPLLAWALIGVTLLAVTLRLYRLDADFWLDEIVTVNLSRESILNLLTVYISTNNHLLNTLLVKFSTAVLGESEWAVRLPAAIFGAATVPALYWVSRFALSRWASVGAAALLAVSYHHVFFSQNARGYAPYLLFSLLATGLFIKALHDDRARNWALYIVVMFLNFASLLNAAFVFAAHAATGAVAVLLMRRQGVPTLPLVKRLLGVFLVTGFLVFQLYAVIIPQVLAYVEKVYTVKSAGYAPFSLEFLHELVRGVSAGFGPGVLLGALPFVVVAGAGFFTLARRNVLLALALLLPAVITAAYLFVKGLAFSPRMFLLGLLLAVMSAIAGVTTCVTYLARWLHRGPRFVSRLQTALVVSICAISAASLTRYYATPKQNYRAAIEYVESLRAPGQVAIAIHLTEKGVRYYSPKSAQAIDQTYFYVRSMAQFDEILAAYPVSDTLLMTTFHRALRLEKPELAARIEQDWEIAREFPATIGDGWIGVWRARSR